MEKIKKLTDHNLVFGISILEKDKDPIHKSFIIYNEKALEQGATDVSPEINITSICKEYMSLKSQNSELAISVYALGSIPNLSKDDVQEIKTSG